MRRAVLILYFALIALMLSGCAGSSVLSSAREVENLELVRTVGIDREDGMVRITVSSGPGTEGSSKFFTGSAPTLSKAINDMQKLPIGKEAVFSHTEHIIISEEAAAEGVEEYLDCVERSDDMRFDTGFFIARGISAGELLVSASGSDIDVSELLQFLTENIDLMGSGCVFTCRDIASSLADRGCALIQAVSAADTGGLFEGEAEKTVLPDGFAVIKDGSLAGFLSGDETRGAMLLMNKTRSEDIALTVDGVTVTVSLSGAEASFTPVFYSGELNGVDISLDLTANIISVSGPLDLMDDSVREAIAEKLSSLEAGRAGAAIDASRAMDADFMGICKKLELASPVRCAKPVENWGKTFKDVDFNITASCDIVRTFDINVPIGTDGKETA